MSARSRIGALAIAAPTNTSSALLWLLVILDTGYTGALALPGGNLDLLGALGSITVWAPLVVCWWAVIRSGSLRIHVLLAAGAVTVYTLSNAYYLLFLYGSVSVAFPSVADVGYLLFYPLMLAALAALVYRQLSGLAWPVLLDSAVGALAAASVLAVVLSPVLSAAHGWSDATVVALGSPLFDLLLVAAVVGIVVSPGLDLGPRWLVLAAGLGLFAATDTIYALELTNGSNAFGTVLDAGWVIGLGMIAAWVDGSARPTAAAVPATASSSALAVPAASTAAALAVLVLATQVHLTSVAVGLAGVTLVAAAARTQVAFRQLVRMADLRREARTDDLTGLANRRALYADVPGLLVDDAHPCALVVLDLDRFKEINDSLGHAIGDRLLVQVARRLSDQLHSGDVLARLGGDEFAVVLDGTSRAGAVAVAVKLRKALAEPFTLDGIALQTDASIGLALFPDQGHDLRTLMRRADMAMRRAKIDRIGYRVYNGSDDVGDDARARTLDELRLALAGDQLTVHYQPKVTLSNGNVYGVEALVRWDHPRRGLLYPDAFVELVEEAGLMRGMTQVVLAKALDQAAAWRRQGHPLTVAVNLSASSLMDTDLPDQVATMLQARELPTQALMLEITEEFLMADRERARSVLTRMRDTGIQIAVDDFGTGYSSLAYLRDLPIDELKLDKSFIFSMADDARAAALVASTVALAHSLSLRMVAEGVENEVAYAELRRYGCDQAQGHFMSRPVPAAVLDQWLVRRTSEQLTGR